MIKDIDISTKSDHEILVLIAERLNQTCEKVERQDRWINGNGLPGAKFQLWVLWAVFIAIVAKVV